MEFIDALELYQHCILNYQVGTKAEFELLSPGPSSLCTSIAAPMIW